MLRWSATARVIGVGKVVAAVVEVVVGRMEFKSGRRFVATERGAVLKLLAPRPIPNPTMRAPPFLPTCDRTAAAAAAAVTAPPSEIPHRAIVNVLNLPGLQDFLWSGLLLTKRMPRRTVIAMCCAGH